MRYLPHSETDRADLLARIGASSIDELFECIPQDRRLKDGLDLPDHQSELSVERKLSAMAAKNTAASSVPFFVGAGAYKHHVPATVDHLIQRSEFLTSYTPYQPEITQGTLQTLFEFQTQVANLTAMDVANASMYDGSTGTAEAVLMAARITRRKQAVLSAGLHPHYAEVVKTTCGMAGEEIISNHLDGADHAGLMARIDDKTSCVVVQSPNVFGEIVDLKPIAEKAREHGALLIAVFTEVIALGLIEPPGAQGADIVVGEGQSIGNGLNFGGPYVGLFATRQKYIRQMPGRLCGQTADADGTRGFVLTLSTREQHIRRDRATSNICTNSGLCCLAFTIHMTLLGEKGLRQLALINHHNAVKLAEMVEAVPDVKVINRTFFNEFTIELEMSAEDAVERMAEKGVLGGVPLLRLNPSANPRLLIVASTEVNTDEDRAAFAAALKEVSA